jgi:hypothetical protein
VLSTRFWRSVGDSLGGPATAAISANGIVGLDGYGAALLVVNLLVAPLGVAGPLSRR